jgi:cell division protein FtsI (penicillin-binding protein 3)
MEDYLKTLPEGSDFKLIFDAVDNYEKKNVDEATSMLEELIAKGCPDGFAIQGIITMERGDTLDGIRLIEQATTAGSTFAELLQCVPDWRGATNPDVDKLTALSDKIPFVNAILAKMYAGYDDENLQNDQLAAYYYLKADEKACLGKRGARWLLGYHRSGANLSLSERDIQRLQILAGETPVDNLEPTSNRDEALEASVSTILQEAMTERNCTKGMVYVVETATGAIKAQVSLSSKGKQFVPYEDTYNEEQSVMMTGPTYLALLSTGKISSDDVIDTEFGIYKNVKDHNWSRGGYGHLTLEQALGYRSQVAFTKAKERVYGNQTVLLDNKISEYLASMPDNAMGMLTFYNAVANGGRMVKLQAEGDNVVVLNEQIAESAHIATLQKGLEHAVKRGLFRKAGRSYTSVAACGRTFYTKGNNRRMELCGYFPADNPMYTIMVVLEKYGVPASAGSMCGNIMAKTIDVLVDSYDLRSMLVREFEESEDVVEVVDTVAVG